MKNTLIVLLSLTVMIVMSKEDDDRNKAVEAAGAAVVGAGLLGGLLVGGGLLAKALGDAAKEQNARSNGGNIVRHQTAHHAPHGPPVNSNADDGECDYNCDGWPYQQCEVTKTFKYGEFRRATCINPYASRSSYQMFSNYPECANIPSGCQRCDDVCSSRDGVYDYSRSGPQYYEYSDPDPIDHSCYFIDDGPKVCP